MWNVIVPLKCRRITNSAISVTLKDIILGGTVTLKEFFWAGSLRRRRMWVLVPLRSFCVVFTCFPCPCVGFLQILRFHLTVQKHTRLLDLELLNAPGCESIFVSWYIELRGNLIRPYKRTVPPPQWKVRVWPQTGTNADCWCSKHQHRQNIWIHELFSFSFVSLWKDPPPVDFSSYCRSTLSAEIKARQHLQSAALALSLSKAKINQSMLRLQAVRSLKSSDWSGGGAHKQWSDMELFVHESAQVVMQISSRDIKIEWMLINGRSKRTTWWTTLN